MAMYYGERHKYSSAMDPLWANAYLGASTSIEPGKAMKDLIGLPASGIENVEISVIEPQKFEAIPREMFSEARRMGRMLIRDFAKDGRPTPISLHSPMVEPTGFSDRGWDESTWKNAQYQLREVVDKAAMLGPSVPLTIHGSNVPSLQTRHDPGKAKEYLGMIENYAQLGGERPPEETMNMLRKDIIPEMMVAVDKITGQIMPMQAEVRTPGPGIRHFMSPQDKIDEHNRSQWQSQQQQLAAYAAELQRLEQTGQIDQRLKETYAHTLYSSAATIFEHAFRADPDIGKIPGVQEAVKNHDYFGAILAIPADKAPKMIQPMEDFARAKASETFANVAMRSYDIATNPGKFLSKDQAKELQTAGVTDISKAPVITIENFSPELAFGRGESLKTLIDESRNKFAAKLMQEKHVPQSKANEIAKQLIGATWDVGHINLLRKYGYDEKQIAAELNAVAKDVKHVHLTDNFGSFDAHLAPGMGNVPIKDFMKILDKEGKLGKVKGIVEAGGYVMSYGENPTLKTLQYFNTPVYGFQQAPSWGGETPVGGTYFMGSSGYSAGYGLMLPPIHYSEYGAGFTGLPTALGAIPGAASKSAFAGTPNA